MATNPTPFAPELSFDVKVEGDQTVVRCTGRITFQTTQWLKNTVSPLISPGSIVVLDLTDVSYMDSSGLGAIVSLYVASKSAKSQLRLIHLNKRLRELFSISRLGEVMADGRDPDEYGIP